MKVAVITTMSKSWQELADITVPVMQDYCAKHNYQFHCFHIAPKFEFHKIAAIIRTLDSGVDLILCLDLDILITNHNVKVEDFIDEEHDFFITEDINELNAGAIILKNTDFTRCWMRDIMIIADRFENEQNALKCDRDHPKVKILGHPSINSYPYLEYAPSWGLIEGRRPLLNIEGKPTHEQGDWVPGDFIAHLPGLPNTRRIEIFNRLKERIC